MMDQVFDAGATSGVSRIGTDSSRLLSATTKPDEVGGSLLDNI